MFNWCERGTRLALKPRQNKTLKRSILPLQKPNFIFTKTVTVKIILSLLVYIEATCISFWFLVFFPRVIIGMWSPLMSISICKFTVNYASFISPLLDFLERTFPLKSFKPRTQYFKRHGFVKLPLKINSIWKLAGNPVR